ncbi:MAG: hypothetical protein JWQ26_3422 [Modestobacter sp.]|nr:hypothetical protein [Modestobacter sp.]
MARPAADTGATRSRPPDLAGKTALELSEVAGDGTCCTTNATDAMSIDVPADVTAEMRMTTKAAACC